MAHAIKRWNGTSWEVIYDESLVAALAISTVAVSAGSGSASGGPVVADAVGDTLTLEAGSGITLTADAATDKVTITNSGVTSAVAGTGVSVSAATGAVTISIGQSVATSASPTFVGLTLTGSLSVTTTATTSQIHTSRVGYWASNLYAHFAHKDADASGYALLCTAAATWISTGSATGSITLRPGLNETTYQVVLADSGAHTMACKSFALTSDATSTGNNFAINIDNSAQTGGSTKAFAIGIGGGDGNSFLHSLLVYNQSVAGTANVIVDSSGRVRRATSSARYKSDIQDYAPDPSAVLNLRPVSFLPKSTIATDLEQRIVGLIAEEVAEVAPEVVIWNEQGTPEALDWSGITVLLIDQIKRLEARITALGG